MCRQHRFTINTSTKNPCLDFFQEFESAYYQLNRSGQFSRKWFNEALAECAKEGGCNFTTIGGVFEFLGEASYSSQGIYKKTLR